MTLSRRIYFVTIKVEDKQPRQLFTFYLAQYFHWSLLVNILHNFNFTNIKKKSSISQSQHLNKVVTVPMIRKHFPTFPKSN